ncbi:MAG: hypothetical protein H7199_12655 [Burkholderiales bacterium]|nr:hypothetical protein [Flavobacterium sp.]
MEVVEVTADDYTEVFPKPYHFFNTATFNALNAYKCEEVFYLVFKDTKIRLGIIFGVRNNILNAPFSAPFGGFESSSDDLRLQQIDTALVALNHWAKTKNFDGIKIVPPSFFYNPNFLNKLDNCLVRAGFDKVNIELNYQFPTAKFDDNYQSIIWYNAKKNLKKAFKSDLIFEKLATQNGQQAYEVIAQNRKERGFPLRMTWAQVEETATVILVDFFVVRKQSDAIGAALIFHVADDVVQVVYWGDLPQFSEYKTMNFLSYELFQYYKKQGIKMVDIGPSTENTIPNYGLCEFKESIGCEINIKTEFFKKLN